MAGKGPGQRCAGRGVPTSEAHAAAPQAPDKFAQSKIVCTLAGPRELCTQPSLPLLRSMRCLQEWATEDLEEISPSVIPKATKIFVNGGKRSGGENEW